jgi:hypothetical protein
MSYEERDNSGCLFRVTEKKGEKFPDYEGKALINGQPVWVSGWLKEGKKGKFLSLSFKPREEKKSRGNEDDVPW